MRKKERRKREKERRKGKRGERERKFRTKIQRDSSPL